MGSKNSRVSAVTGLALMLTRVRSCAVAVWKSKVRARRRVVCGQPVGGFGVSVFADSVIRLMASKSVYPAAGIAPYSVSDSC